MSYACFHRFLHGRRDYGATSHAPPSRAAPRAKGGWRAGAEVARTAACCTMAGPQMLYPTRGD
jgi:hypothetical protein